MNFLLRRIRMNGYTDIETFKKANELLTWQKDSKIMDLYERFKTNPKIKWKESIKKIVDLEISESKGLDI